MGSEPSMGQSWHTAIICLLKEGVNKTHMRTVEVFRTWAIWGGWTP